MRALVSTILRTSSSGTSANTSGFGVSQPPPGEPMSGSRPGDSKPPAEPAEPFEPGDPFEPELGYAVAEASNGEAALATLHAGPAFDLLLDVAATGENVVEREGLSVRHPARFVLVGSGNPEEGELRPQLLSPHQPPHGPGPSTSVVALQRIFL